MKEMKKNVIIGVLCVLVIIMGGYIAYDYVKSNDLDVSDLESEEVNNQYVSNNRQSYDLEKLEKYKSADGSYPTVGDKYYATDSSEIGLVLGSDGLVYDTSDEKNYITNIENAIDMIYFIDDSYNPENSQENLYILTSGGKVYRYNLSNLKSNNYIAEIMDIENVNEIMKVNYMTEVGERSYLIAITNDLEYIELAY